jgi:predicted Zn-dependent protease with MMP-like domain
MNQTFFEAKVKEAMESLPEAFLKKMDNLEIVVEDFPDAETLESVGLTSKWDLLGLYSGVPLTHRSFFTYSILPERIYLYRVPIIRSAVYDRNLTAAIRSVLVHEIGHHFGFDDQELDDMMESYDDESWR